MRIQHNIMAMNAYRNYSNNVSAMKSNLEKLSSGYKINRAGDDAAGLAISEKMRAQITGLETAQKNAKDGISLVQTAEGALTEVHDMLNRMVELATQSANGTYDGTDREQLQKEVDQLLSEINRIADSSNFNGIQLLDGSMDADGEVANTTTVFSGLTASSNVNGSAVASGVNAGYGGANTNGTLKLTGMNLGAVDGNNNALAEPYESDTSVRYHKDSDGPLKTSFTVDLDGVNFDSAGPGTQITDVWLALDGGTGSDFLCLNGKANDANTNSNIGVKGGDTRVLYTATAGSDGITSKDIASAIMDAINTDGEGDGIVYLKNGSGEYIQYKVTQEDDKLHFEMTDEGYTTAAASDDDDAFRGNYNFAVAQSITGYDYSGDDDTLAFLNSNAFQHVATSNVVEGAADGGTIYAEAAIRFDADGTGAGCNEATSVIKDGAGIQLGDNYYVFAGSDATYNTKYADNVHVVDIRDLENLDNLDSTDADELAAAETDLKYALERLTAAAANNEMFDVQVAKGGSALIVTERTTYNGGANLTMNRFGLENQIRTFDSATSTTDVTKEAGKALTLQIGDTADSYNQLSVNIKDIHASSLGLEGLDISTQEGAQAAIDKIKAAINYVSDVRGTLGATQNRLDHTINNLSVMTENIQDAESTIRDTDVAEEMMAYTKNNILIQSAQAMLAQANQVPQGVLQLLQ